MQNALEKGLLPDDATLQQLVEDRNSAVYRLPLNSLPWPDEPLRAVLIRASRPCYADMCSARMVGATCLHASTLRFLRGYADFAGHHCLEASVALTLCEREFLPCPDSPSPCTDSLLGRVSHGRLPAQGGWPSWVWRGSRRSTPRSGTHCCGRCWS